MHDRATTSDRGLGIFVTFEGGEGAGKSTQVARLRARLSGLGREVVVTREPGGSPRAEAIRQLLLDGRAAPCGPFAEAVLFAAARADHVDTLLRPALDRGAVVLCDRFLDSSRVYQGSLAGLPSATIAVLERTAIGATRPALTVVIDVPAETGLRRATARRVLAGGVPDRFEREGAEYHRRVRDAFLAIARAEPDRCVVVDGSAGPDEVEAAIWDAVSARLSPNGARIT